MTMTETATAPRAAELEGLVDNATETRLYGWAWNAAAPGERVSIELRLGEEIVARTVAERMRSDLAKAGVGDGHHAFELPLKREWSDRHKDLAVIVRAADGTESQLALRVRRGDIDPTGALQRVLEATASSHRQLREELNRIAIRLPAEDSGRDEAIRTLAESQGVLIDKLETLTIWLTRMDERLATLSAPAPAAPRRRVDPWQIGLGAVLSIVVAAAGFGTALLMNAAG